MQSLLLVAKLFSHWLLLAVMEIVRDLFRQSGVERVESLMLDIPENIDGYVCLAAKVIINQIPGLSVSI